MKRNIDRSAKNVRALTLIVAALCLCSVLGCGRRDKADNNNDANAKASASDEGAQALDDSDWARAYVKFSDALAENENDVDARYARASAALEIARGHYQLAQAAATNNDVKTGETEATKADEYFQKALDDCDAILKLDPKFADAYFLKGVVAQFQGAWEDGLAAFSECIKLDATRADAYHARGEIYDHIGDYMNSSVDFKKATDLGYVAESDSDVASADASDPNDFSDLNYDADDSSEQIELGAETP